MCLLCPGEKGRGRFRQGCLFSPFLVQICPWTIPPTEGGGTILIYTLAARDSVLSKSSTLTMAWKLPLWE